MKTKKIKILAVALCITISLAIFASCAPNTDLIWNVAEEFDTDMLAFEDAEVLLQNSDRGLRMEHYITLGHPLFSYPNDRKNPFDHMKYLMNNRYEADKPTVVQLYVYLTQYRHKPLDWLAFQQMEEMLNILVDNNVKALLRFAYQNESHPDPKIDIVRVHLDQIADWFRINRTLVEKSITAMQTGIFGNWGEGHGMINLRESHKKKVYAALFDMTPDWMFIQARSTQIARRVHRSNFDRLGMHDDYIVGDKANDWTYFLGKTSRRVLNHDEIRFRSTMNDAEMPWARATYMDRDGSHGLYNLPFAPILQQFRQYSLSTFSLEHNYIEWCRCRRYLPEGQTCEGGCQFASLNRWKDEKVTIDWLREQRLPFLPTLFTNGQMDVYNYIRFHLGYLLTFHSVDINQTNRTISFTIQNNGFAAPMNAKSLRLFVGGQYISVPNFNRFALGSMQSVRYTVSIPSSVDMTGGNVGIRLLNQGDIPIRFANATPFVNGVQFFPDFI
jgi:hypothetical protein